MTRAPGVLEGSDFCGKTDSHANVTHVCVGEGVAQKGNERSNKKGKKNRSVKVHGGEVKQSPFERQTKEWRGF